MILRENKVILDEYYLELRNQISERSFKIAVCHLEKPSGVYGGEAVFGSNDRCQVV